MMQIETHWHVLTGAPSSGKTTILNLLEAFNVPVRHEFARKFIEGQLALGKELAEIIADQRTLQYSILMGCQEVDSALPTKEPYVLDRSPVDAIAHYQMLGLDCENEIFLASRFRYKKIFFLESLPFQHDGVRIQKDEDEATMLEQYFRQAYEMLDYELVDVPILSPQERTSFILDRMYKD